MNDRKQIGTVTTTVEMPLYDGEHTDQEFEWQWEYSQPTDNWHRPFRRRGKIIGKPVVQIFEIAYG